MRGLEKSRKSSINDFIQVQSFCQQIVRVKSVFSHGSRRLYFLRILRVVGILLNLLNICISLIALFNLGFSETKDPHQPLPASLVVDSPNFLLSFFRQLFFEIISNFIGLNIVDEPVYYHLIVYVTVKIFLAQYFVFFYVSKISQFWAYSIEDVVSNFIMTSQDSKINASKIHTLLAKNHLIQFKPSFHKNPNHIKSLKPYTLNNTIIDKFISLSIIIFKRQLKQQSNHCSFARQTRQFQGIFVWFRICYQLGLQTVDLFQFLYVGALDCCSQGFVGWFLGWGWGWGVLWRGSFLWHLLINIVYPLQQQFV